MLYRCFILILAVLCVCRVAAQGNKNMWLVGYGYQFVQEEESYPNISPTVSRQNYYFYGLTTELNHVLWQSDDEVSVVVNPNLFVWASWYGGPLDVFVQAPTYLALHVGAGCTPFNEQALGIGAGVGVVPSLYYHTGSGPGGYTATQTMMNPGAMVELYTPGGGYFDKVRVNWSLSQSISDNGTQHLAYSTFGLTFVYML